MNNLPSCVEFFIITDPFILFSLYFVPFTLFVNLQQYRINLKGLTLRSILFTLNRARPTAKNFWCLFLPSQPPNGHPCIELSPIITR